MIIGMGIQDAETGEITEFSMDQLEEISKFKNELELVALKKEQEKLEISNAPEIHKAALDQAVKAQSCLVDFNRYTNGQTYNLKVALGGLLLGLAADEAKHNYAGVLKHNPR